MSWKRHTDPNWPCNELGIPQTLSCMPLANTLTPYSWEELDLRGNGKEKNEGMGRFERRRSVVDGGALSNLSLPANR